MLKTLDLLGDLTGSRVWNEREECSKKGVDSLVGFRGRGKRDFDVNLDVNFVGFQRKGMGKGVWSAYLLYTTIVAPKRAVD